MLSDNESLGTKGYNPVRDDHPENAKRGRELCRPTFTNQTNIFIDFRGQRTLNSKCHH